MRKKKIGKFILTAVIAIILLSVSSFLWSRSFKMSITPELAIELRGYCKKNNLSEDYCIVVDYSIYSGRDRLFIVDLRGYEILYSSLCAHGIGKNFDCIVKPKFSNDNGSNYSSLGHFKLGKIRKTSQYDLNAIELYGLDSCNSNAYARGILIHDGLPNVRIIGLPCLPLSQGCFTVTSNAFKEIADIKAKSKKPMLIYSTETGIFNSI